MFEYITYRDKRGNDEFENWIRKLSIKSETSKHDRIQFEQIAEYIRIFLILEYNHKISLSNNEIISYINC